MSADIFVSYASEDRERVRPLVEALRQRGWTVWWDHEIDPGADYRRRIEQALAAARCVVVAWTLNSVNSKWVVAEAKAGLQRQILVPVMFDTVRVPEQFGHQNCAQLIGWAGDPGHPELERLARSITKALAEGNVQPGIWRRAIRAAAAACVVLLGAWLALRAPDTPRPLPPENSIAVLPFANLGPAADAYRSEGLSLELLSLLSRVRELAVVSPTSSFALQGNTTDVGSRLGVRYLVEGALKPEGNSATVDVRLVEADSRRVLWSDRRTVASDGLAGLPGEAARGIVATLEVTLSDESRAQLEAKPTADPAALDQYLRGIKLLRSRTNDETLAAADQAFRRAIEIDGNYAMPYAGLCRVQVLRYERMLEVSDYTAAEENCRRTLTLNALQADPHNALGGLYLASGRLAEAGTEYGKARRLAPRDADAVIGLADVAARRSDIVQAEKLHREAIALEPYYWRTHASLGRFLFERARYPEAVTAYRRTVELDPQQARAYEDLGGAYYMNGAFEDALAAWQKALAMEPGATAYTNVGTAEFFLRHFDAAAAMYRKAIEIEPRDDRWRGNLGDALRLAGKPAEAGIAYQAAAELARESLAVNPGDRETRMRLAIYDAHLGRVELARMGLDDALRLTHDDPYAYYFAAVAWANMGMAAQALEALGNAVRLGYPSRLVAADPLFDPLRSDEGYQRIVR